MTLKLLFAITFPWARSVAKGMNMQISLSGARAEADQLSRKRWTCAGHDARECGVDLRNWFNLPLDRRNSQLGLAEGRPCHRYMTQKKIC